MAKYGDVDLQTAPIAFPSGAAPDPSGGQPPPTVHRKFVSFDRLVDPAKLARVGKASLRIERELLGRSRGRREPPVRLAPGYVTSANVIQSSTKNAAHRIYLGQGIYAEVALVVREGRMEPEASAEEDFRTPPVLEFLRAARERYLEQVQLVPPA